METDMMKVQLSFSVMGFVLATAALGFTAVRQLPSLPFREISLPSLSWATSSDPRHIYCENGGARQFSNVHHGWVCSTELRPTPSN
jgi:hypothetical protein